MSKLTRRQLIQSGLAVSANSVLSVQPVPAKSMNAASSALPVVPADDSDKTKTRERLRMDSNWKFALGNANDPLRDFQYGKLDRERTFAKSGRITQAKEKFDDSSWRTVDLPHDWAVELPFVATPPAPEEGGKPLGREFPETSIGWYRKTFVLSAQDEGKCIQLEFDGIYRDATVFLNGHYLGTNFSGYAPFILDITDWVNIGRPNTLAIRVDATLGDGWFYEGAGIYRHVWLIKSHSTFLNNGGETGSNFEETWAGSSTLQNLYDLSYAANDINRYTQSIVKGYVLYVLPFGKGRHYLSNRGRWADGAVSGWTLGALLYYSTGTPLSVYDTNYYPGLSSTIYPNVATGADLSRHFVGKKFDPSNFGDPGNMYINPAGFSAPAFGAFGNSGPYVAGLNGFGTAQENISVHKDFRIREGMKLQIRAEFYNLFNRHYFTNPNTSIGGAYFGDVTSVGGSPRNGQLGARFEW